MATTNTLLLVNERKLRDLFPSNPPTGHLEASGVLAMDGKFFIVFDNRTDVAKINDDLSPDQTNGLFGMARGRKGYEGITYNPYIKRFYLLIESRKTKSGEYRPEIFEYDDSLAYVKDRPIDFTFTTKNRGFEAVAHVRRDGQELGQLESIKEFTRELVPQRAVGWFAPTEADPGDVVVFAPRTEARAERGLH